ncbi:unnamed protein product, partial [Musa acuminata var. zebrina]
KIPTKKKRVNQILYQIHKNKTKRNILKRIARDQTLKKVKKKKQSKKNKEGELDLFLKKYFIFQLRWDDP